MGKIESGMIEWVDLSTPDVEHARRFYGELLGWTFDVHRTDMGEYVVAEADGRQVAGMMAPSHDAADQPSTWTTFVRVDDIEDTVGKVTDAGGTVAAPPFEIPGGARVAVVTDRTGAMFALICGGPEPDQAYFSQQDGGVCWAELMTSSVDDAVEFYHQVFGWTAETSTAGPIPYTTCRLDASEVAGMIGRPHNIPPEIPDSWSVYFTVSDCAETEKQATELGGSVILPSTPTPMGPFAVIADPMGAAFQIMQIKDMATAEAD